MLRVVYNKKHAKGQWRYAFFAGDTMVAQMRTVARAGEIKIGRDIFFFKRYSRYYALTERYGLEHDEKKLATANHNIFLSTWWLNHQDREHELALRIGWSWNGNARCRLFEAGHEIGQFLKGDASNDGASIDLPDEMPLPTQLFSFRVAQIVWQRASSWSGGPMC